jgi:hypothetical protein
MSEIYTDVLHPSRSTFLAIFDSEGDIQDVYPSNTVRDEVFRRCQVLDSQFPDCAPHTVWEYDAGEWHKLKERIHTDPGMLRLATPIRTK